MYSAVKYFELCVACNSTIPYKVQKIVRKNSN